MRGTRLTHAYYFTPERSEGAELTQVRKSRSHVYRILFFKTSAARLDEIRVPYIIFKASAACWQVTGGRGGGGSSG